MTQQNLDRVEHIFVLYHKHGYSQSKISSITGIPRSTISRWLNHPENIAKYSKYLLSLDSSYGGADDEDNEGDENYVSKHDVISQNIKLARRVQLLQDTNRIERKTFRETARIENTLETLNAALLEVFRTNKVTSEGTTPHKAQVKDVVGVVHLSDLHFNELIDDIQGNKFDFSVASKRLQKYVDKVKRYFNTYHVTHVAVFLTGDLLNSDRRLDEITNAATNRSQAIFLAVDILQQLLLDLADDYTVNVTSVTGNESRVGEHIQWSSFLASDSYDLVIHNILSYVLIDDPRITFNPIEDPLEAVVNVNGTNFLLVHGHGHSGLANTNQIERQITALKGKYGQRGVDIGYVICGHIHSALISDQYARNSGLPGTNAYAEKALNLNGKSSQNAYLVWKDGTIDGIKVDLQKYEDYEGYPFNHKLQAHFRESTSRNSTVVIQSVII